MKSFFEKSGNINYYNFIVFFKYNFNFVKENREEKIKEIEKLGNDCDLTFKKYHSYINNGKTFQFIIFRMDFQFFRIKNSRFLVLLLSPLFPQF